MKWLTKNSYLSMILGFSVIFIAYIFLTDNNIETYEQIEIAYGDTLWLLADNYSGQMGRLEWIALVKKINYLHTDTIVEGQQLLVPVVTKSNFLASKHEAQQSITVVSDSQWKMQ